MGGKKMMGMERSKDRREVRKGSTKKYSYKKKVKEEVKVVVKEPKLVDFESALKRFKLINVYKAHLMDKEIVKIFIEKRIPSLKATQEEFDKLFKKF